MHQPWTLSLSPDDCRDFVLAHTEPMRPELVPEIELRLATQPFGIFAEADTFQGDQPYWAFAWGGGQALARWLLDNPHVVTGKRVLDIGSGSGLTSIAALKAGAAHVVANDIDPVACSAACINAGHNSVDLQISSADLLAGAPRADVILIGDLFYMPELVTRVDAFLNRASRRGATVLFGDRKTIRRPTIPMRQLAEYNAKLTPEMEIDYVEISRVWQLG
jgi:predicted nicotinamide N-methyase